MHDTRQWKRLQRNRDLLDSAIEEGLRCATPVPVSTRSTAMDCEFHGAKLTKDQLVLITWARAIREDRVIERDTKFDIARTIPRELQTVLMALLDGAPDIEIVKRRAARKVLLPTWDELWVRRA